MREFEHAFAPFTKASDKVFNFLFSEFVGIAEDEAVEDFCDSADVGGYAHFVIVEDDNDVAFIVTDVVEGFVGETAGHSAVADNGDDAVVLVLEVASGGHTESGGEGGAGAGFESGARRAR